jgi:hypothetical protein
MGRESSSRSFNMLSRTPIPTRTIALCIALALPATATAQKLTPAQWGEDLDVVVDVITKRHVNAFTRVPREKWLEQAAEVRAKLPGLTDTQAALAILRLVACVGDSHTGINISRSVPLRGYPVQFASFDDGLFLVTCPADDADLLGGKITTIHSVPTPQAIEKIAQLVAAENPVWVASQTQMLAATADVLVAVGLADPLTARSSLTIQTVDGKTRTLDLVPGPKPTASALDARKFAAHPTLGRRPNGTFYGHAPAAASPTTLYAYYDTCADQPGQPTVADWTTRLLADFDTGKHTRLVIDLRRNGGGNSALLAPLVQAIPAHPTLSKPGALIVLVGRQTFSSAILNALELKRAGAILVGSPTGGSPHHFGEIKSLALPNSRIPMTYSTRTFGDPARIGQSLQPDHVVPRIASDFLAIDDTAFTKTLALP